MKVFLFPLLISLPIAQAQLAPAKDHPKIRIPKGLELKQFADKTQIIQPTTLCLDDQGNVYVAETHRWRRQVQDIRHGGSKREDLIGRVRDDISIMDRNGRMEFYKKWSGKHPSFLKLEEFDDHAEVIKLLKDTDGDGKADEVHRFRDDFNEPLAGPSGGLIEKDGTVFFSMIPAVYSLRDRDGDGKAEEVKTLVDGFGLRISFSGHDMNGFAWGPDGKLYWSIGDRGYDVSHEGKNFTRPDSGAVFRINPDGTDFEIYAINLRNPKEIVFDEFGNLFTVDNDYDKGDRERIVHLVEHGDSGWKMGHQTIGTFSESAYNHMGPRKPKLTDALDAWMNEQMWKPRNDRQPAHIIPPVANSVNGPCGLAYNPGVTALGDRFAKHFFIASYVGSSAACGVGSFTLKPDGAGFALDQEKWFMKGSAVTDLDWGPDGKLYLSDYGGGWVRPEKGAIFTLADPKLLGSTEVQKVKALFAKGFSNMDAKQLFELLAHKDQRVRKRAQFALAERGSKSASALKAAIKKGQPLLRRVHGIWGLGQLADKNPAALKPLAALFNDSKMEVRANLARTLGNHPEHLAPYQSDLIKLLRDTSPRVASLAAIALANQGDEKSVAPALALLEKNADRDVIVRHGGIMILAKAAPSSTLVKLKDHPSAALRRAAVVALRRQGASEIASFFQDKDRSIREEAIRGAYDENIIATFSKLSSLAHEISKEVTKEMEYHPLTARRAIHAAWTLGRESDLKVITGIINDSTVDFRVRRDAIISLLDWNEPPVPDPVTGFVRTLPQDRIKLPADILDMLKPLYEGAPDDRPAARLLPWSLDFVKHEKLPLSSSQLTKYLEAGWVRDIARVASLEMLAARNPTDEDWKLLLRELAEDKNDKVRSKAREVLFRVDKEGAFDMLAKVLENPASTLSEKQFTLQTLSKLKTPKAASLLNNLLDQLIAGKVESGLALDITTAAEATADRTVKAKLEKYRKSVASSDPLAEWFAVAQYGGDINRGKKLFYSHASGQCQRCHMMNGTGGDVGPELAAIGKTRDEAFLLRALITPNSEVAEGYGIGAVTLKDGTTVSGTILPDDRAGNAQVKVGKDIKTIAKAKIQNRTQPMSGMPPMAGILTQAEARDIVAYLRSCVKDYTDDKHK